MCDEGSSSAAGFEKLIFQQELNEVYLLLDYVSGQPTRHLKDLDNTIVDPNTGSPIKVADIVKRVSGLRYPPSPPSQAAQKGEDAAFLLLLKDALNTLAFPARGLTIAYTILFSEGGKGSKTSRFRAAELAFPGLVSSAGRFRIVKGVLSWSGLAITIVAALLLWEVTYGAQLAAHFDEAKRNDAQSAAAIYHEIDRRDDKSELATSLDPVEICRITDADHAKAFYEGIPDHRDSALRQLCDEYAYRHALFCVAISDIGRYSRSRIFKATRRLLPIHFIKPSNSCGSSDPSVDTGRQEDAPSIAGVLAMMSNYFLTILFGLAGTLTALVRGIQDKVTDSILLPRDQALSLIRLPLGMIAGISVGLFLTPSSVLAQSAGSIGAFTLTASGIAFLAGYGAEAFFRALDTLINRTFNLDKDTRPLRT